MGGGSGKKLKDPVAEKVCEARLAVHVISYASVRGVREDRENGKGCLVALRGTAPLANFLPLTDTDTTRDCEGELKADGEIWRGAALAIWENVTGESIRIAMSPGLPDFASSAK